MAHRVGCPTLLPEKYLLKISIEETLVVGSPGERRQNRRGDRLPSVAKSAPR